MEIKAAELADRLVRRLADSDPSQVRQGIRGIAHQVVERRLDVIRALRPRIAGLQGSEFSDFNRGIHACLLDTLMAATSALEPGEERLQAKHDLEKDPNLRKVFLALADGQRSVLEIQLRTQLSEVGVTHHLSCLRVRGLVETFPGPTTSAFDQRPVFLTGLGRDLLSEIKAY